MPQRSPAPQRRSRVLFICKRRRGYWGMREQSGGDLSSGLHNSVTFLVEMLAGLGVAAKLVEVVDNNSIDREVAAYRPTHAIIEALWVVPEKFDILKKLHPRVQWIVRTHSEAPFLANEGIAAAWIAGYLERGVEIMCNSAAAQAQLRAMAVDFGDAEALVTYGPNFYPLLGRTATTPHAPLAGDELHIGCFGAIRPLKNHLVQAIAAIAFANAQSRKLRFHVNAGRVEGGAAAVLNNLRALFAGSAGGRHVLIEQDWVPHPQFLKRLASEIDISMQVSFSETFNIVAADSAAVGLPVIGSAAIPWLGRYAQVPPGDIGAIEAAIDAVWNADLHQRLALQSEDLRAWSGAAQAEWAARFQ
ncbi:MAG: hypothetical protein ACREE2_00890 [Stellaceae bacterium]